MKNTIMIFLLIMNSLCGFAQANNLFIDLGLPLDTHIPGVSMTYNRKLIRHLGFGIGMQEYYYSVNRGGNNNVNQFTPAVFGDIRAYFPHKKSLFMLIADLGIDFYRGPTYGTIMAHNDGFYTGLGLGYCYRINRRGVGPYVTLRMVSDAFKQEQYNIITQDQSYVTSVNGTAIIAVGFKF